MERESMEGRGGKAGRIVESDRHPLPTQRTQSARNSPSIAQARLQSAPPFSWRTSARNQERTGRVGPSACCTSTPRVQRSSLRGPTPLADDFIHRLVEDTRHAEIERPRRSSFVKRMEASTADGGRGQRECP